MISWFSGFERNWTQHFWTQAATLTLLASSFTVIVFFLVVCMNFRQILADWGKQVQITAYLKEDLTTTQRDAAEAQLKKFTEVDSVHFVSAEEAARGFAKQLSHYAPDLLGAGGFESSFPASFAIQLKSNQIQLMTLTEMAEKFRRISGVEDVSYGQEWVENYSQFISSLAAVGWTITLILAIGAMFVIGNSIATAISQHHDEIEILELIGATSSMIRRPYVIDGALMGALAMVMSLGLNFIFFKMELKVLSTSWSFMGLADKISYLGILPMLGLIMLASFIGALGSYLAVRTLNHGWAASQRVNA